MYTGGGFACCSHSSSSVSSWIDLFRKTFKLEVIGVQYPVFFMSENIIRCGYNPE